MNTNKATSNTSSMVVKLPPIVLPKTTTMVNQPNKRPMNASVFALKLFIVPFSFVFCFIFSGSLGYTQPPAGQQINAPTKGVASGESANKSNQATKPKPNRNLSITESFEPAFSIEPLSRKLVGRPGDVMPFEFKIESTKDSSNIEVVPIGLRQEISGQILHDESAKQADMLRLTTPTKMSLEANRPVMIQGVVRIPSGDAKHYSLGILVRDTGKGDQLQPQFNPDGSRKTQAAITFMTQYVLRLDLTVEGARGEQGRELDIVDTKLVPSEGRPRLQTMVRNPTDTAFEFEIRSRLRSSPSDRSFKQLRMVMPVRASIEDEGRYIGRILPKSQVRLEELLPEAIASGNYEAEVELVVDGRVIKQKVLPMEVDARDYPAQEVLIAQVGSDLLVSPAQVELSQLRGGNRRLTMLLQNKSKSAKTISLKAVGSNKLPIESVLIQPDSVSLPAGGSRKLAVTLKGIAGSDRQSDYGQIVVDCQTEGRDYHETRDLPLAVLVKKGKGPDISMSPIAWDPFGNYPAFRATLRNEGDTHLPLQGRLTIGDESGRRWSSPGGFGKWILPGQSAVIEFRLDNPLNPGDYQVRCEILRGDDSPLVTQQAFTVTDIENASQEKRAKQ
jgi:hypothetical protein